MGIYRIYMLGTRPGTDFSTYITARPRPCVRILSMGAGVQTTACLIKWYKEYDHVVFADTQDERPETYAYIDKYLKPFCEEKKVPWVTVGTYHGQSLLEYCKTHNMMPTRMNRFCTKEFKIRPIRRYIRKLGATAKAPCLMDLGISMDESHRVNDSGPHEVKYAKKNYPLIDAKMTRQDCLNLIKDYGWDLPVKSGCDFCPFMGMKRLKWLYGENPDKFRQVVEMEEGAKNYPQMTLFDGRRLRDMMNNQKLDAWVDEPDMSCDSGHCFG